MTLLQSYLQRHDNRQRIYCVLMQLFLLLYVPLIGKAGNLVMIAILAFWLTEPELWDKVREAFRDRRVIALVSYYAIFIVGLLYTENMQEGFSQLEKKAALLVFPIVLHTLRLSYATVVTLLKTYIVAAILAGFAGLLNGIYLYIQTGLTSYLYSDNLTLLMNGGQAIYFSVTVTVAIVFIVYLAIRQQFSKREKYLYQYGFLPFLFVLLFLLAGRLSLLIVAMLTIVMLTVFIVRKRNYTFGFAMAAVLFVSLIALGVFFPKTINRFKSLTYFHFDYADGREVYHFDETDYEGRWSGLTIRLAIWSCTIDAALESPVIGVGTGDHLDKLFESYRQKNFRQGLLNEFRPHNQYLHAFLSAGIIGLFVLLCSLIVPAIQAFLDKNWLYLVFLFIAAANMMTMDFLDVYRGVIFFAFFNSLLLFQLPRYRYNTSE